jgi:Baseplate J-like protein
VNAPVDAMTEPNPTRLACGDRSIRRDLVRDDPEKFGVDFVEVEPSPSGEEDPSADAPVQLRVGLLEESLPGRLGTGNFRFEGGHRIHGSDLRVTEIEPCPSHDPHVPIAVRITLNRRGDFAPYVLRLVEADRRRPNEPTSVPLRGVDPVFDRASFQFPPPPDCADGVEADCALASVTPPPVPAPPGGAAVIDYLARDFEDLRDLMLRRLRVTLPYWTDRHASDLMLTLVELLAYAGDRLSYAQDAVATEAYLATARRRISVRRLARLIDYRISEGCAARTWVSLAVDAPVEIELTERTLRFRTAADPGRPRGAADDGSMVFEPVVPSLGPTKVSLTPGFNVLSFYSWGDEVCRLPKGATSATLWPGPGQFLQLEDAKANAGDHDPSHAHSEALDPTAGFPPAEVFHATMSPLRSDGEPPPKVQAAAPKPGDVLIFVEVIGPRTGNPADADPTHRHAVRLTGVQPREDPINGKGVWEVTWDVADGLPFPVTISCLVPEEKTPPVAAAPGRRASRCKIITDVTVAMGNVLLVEHGMTLHQFPEPMTVPAATFPPAQCVDAGPPLYPPPIVPRYRPVLATSPLTHAEPFPRPDLIALRQAHSLRQVRDRIANAFLHARQGLIAGGDLLHGPEPLGWMLAGLVDARAMDRAGLTADALQRSPTDQSPEPDQERLDKKRSHQIRALARLEARPGAQYQEVLRRIDAIIRRLERGRPLSEVDQAQFQGLLGLDATDSQNRERLESLGLVWDSPRWYGTAVEALRPDPGRALPAVRLEEVSGDGDQPANPPIFWDAQADLLSSGPDDRHFVAEIDDEGRATLRFAPPAVSTSAFADVDALGRAPDPGQSFMAEYRAGQGSIGNIAADSLVRIEGLNASVFQPLPARGGADPETLEHVRRVAPGSIKGTIERAITADDYAVLALRHPGVAEASATSHSDGVGTRIVVALHSAGDVEASTELLEQVHGMLESYRRLNHAIAVVPATYVALGLTLQYRVAAGAQAGHVRSALLDVFSAGRSTRRPGGLGYFHPDLWTFGRPVEVGPIVAEALAVAGVRDAAVVRLVRLDPPGGASALLEVERDAVLSIGPLEIARLVGDPSLPERGVLRLVLADESCARVDPPDTGISTADPSNPGA